MAVSSLLDIGATAATSQELTLADGEASTISVCRADGEPMETGDYAELRIKGSNDEYNPTGFLLNRENPSLVISAVGVYVVMRKAADGAFGVDFNGGTAGDPV